jgi:hypothetical protein
VRNYEIYNSRRASQNEARFSFGLFRQGGGFMSAPTKIIRVFPHRTTATPDDALAFTTPPPKELPGADEVHVSVAFTYDLPKAEKLAEAWARTGLPVSMGGPAFNQPGGDFVPGLYLKQGYVITSRGCPRRCWFCSVPVREGGKLRELPIVNGHNILDDNLLACSERHIRNVFDMLKQQAKHPADVRRPVFTGGLEAALLRPWHVGLLREVKAARMYFAYDQPGDYEPLVEAGRLLRDGGITKASHRAACYVLVAYVGDTMDAADARLRAVWEAGFVPYAMLYRDGSGAVDADWRRFTRAWVRPEIVLCRLKNNQ